jgi:tetratricopeptide (TPR) repeat protein
MHFVGWKHKRFEQAEQWARYADGAMMRLSADPDLEASLSYEKGLILWAQGHNAAAEAQFRRSLALAEQKRGSEDLSVAKSLEGLAFVLRDTGQQQAALELARRAVAVSERGAGARHPRMAYYRNNLAFMLMQLGRWEEALAELRRAVEISEQVLGPEHADLLPALDNIGECLRELGHFDEALTLYRRAFSIAGKAYGEAAHPARARLIQHRGQVYLAQGRPTPALADFLVALRMIEATQSAQALEVADCAFNIGEALRMSGRPAAALTRYQQSLTIIEKTQGRSASAIPPLLSAMGQSRLAAGQIEAALAPLERAVKLFEQQQGDPERLSEARFALAQALDRSGRDPARARALAEAAIRILPPSDRGRRRRAEIEAWERAHTASLRRASAAR